MKRVSNELIKKEFKKTKNNLIIGIVFLSLSILCSILTVYENKREPKNTISLHEAIETTSNYDLTAHIDVKEISNKITNISGNSNKILVMVSDDEYMYLIAVDQDKFDELFNKEDLKENPVRLYGKTKSNSIVKSTTIRWFNAAMKDSEFQLSSSDFDSYLGNIYLDTTEVTNMSIVLVVINLISGICAFSFLLVYFIWAGKTNSVFKKIDDDELAKIEKDLEGKDTFHYERARLILSNKYILSFGGNIMVMKIKDIYWIYEHRLRQNGITTQKSLFVLNKEGKTKSIMNVDGVTKKSTAVLQEVMETIAKRNEEILVGYSKENQEKAREYIKELKKQKKENKKNS